MSFQNSMASMQMLSARSIAAEKAYVGCLITAGTLLDRADIRVNPQELYTPELAIILQAIIELYEEGVQADIVTLAQKLTDK